MNKKLPTENIANELAGSSVFFQSPSPIVPASDRSEPVAAPQPTPQAAKAVTSSNAQSSQGEKQDVTLSRNRAITQPGKHDERHRFNQDGTIEEQLDVVRKAVKQLGKELSTHRFTAEEKAALADIIYTYTRQGVRTSENEITRIAVNWLLLDYHQQGANSVLARLLERLHS